MLRLAVCRVLSTRVYILSQSILTEEFGIPKRYTSSQFHFFSGAACKVYLLVLMLFVFCSARCAPLATSPGFRVSLLRCDNDCELPDVQHFDRVLHQKFYQE